ncbi:putative reverse transcriptase domain protein [Rhizoctonia solani 123E]|nr:putative reverse transcriptase domain protein [Rhizoctonia solani 123E]
MSFLYLHPPTTFRAAHSQHLLNPWHVRCGVRPTTSIAHTHAPAAPRTVGVFVAEPSATPHPDATRKSKQTENLFASRAAEKTGSSMEPNSATDLIALADAAKTRVEIHPTSVPCAENPTTAPKPALLRPQRPPLLLLPDMWEAELRDLGLLEEFNDVPTGLRVGFKIGAAGPVTKTTIPDNHSSARAMPDVITEHITQELAAGRYSGPYNKNSLEHLIGPFSVAPLGVVDKPSAPGKFRIIQDFSYPRNHPSTSLNSQIDPDEFTCTWGFFGDVVKIIAEAPPGSLGATFDVESAYRQMPIHDDDLPHTVVHWNGDFYIDHRAPFGAASSNGIFGRCGDSMATIYTRRGFGRILKWVDDFVFIHFPPDSPDGMDAEIFGSVDAVYALADRLGWPWKRAKTVPFGSSFVYLGLNWDIPKRHVSIPCKKREKYSKRVRTWADASKVSLKETQEVIGSLVHCSMVIPEGRPKLAGLIAFAASFPHAHSKRFIRKAPSTRALSDTSWWLEILQIKDIGCQIQIPPPPMDLEIFTDASTSHGLGVIVGSEWAAWTLLDGWKQDSRDIGWAEAIAVEMAIFWVIQNGIRRTSITVRCDNQGVVFAWKAGRSRNAQQNDTIARVMALCMSNDIHLSLEYIESALNPADRPSRGLSPEGSLVFVSKPPEVPRYLRPYISRYNPLPHPLSVHSPPTAWLGNSAQFSLSGFLPVSANWAALPPDLSAQVELALSHGYAKGTLSNYESARKSFLDFCERHHVPAHLRFPAGESILCGFAASMAAEYSGSYASNVISGLKNWHIVHNQPWLGSARLGIILRGVNSLAPPESKKQPRSAVTPAMLTILANELVWNNGEDLATFAAALVAFWGQCRLGELLGCARTRHQPDKLPSRTSLMAPFTAAGSCELHLPSTKMQPIRGEKVTILRQHGILDPIHALYSHLAFNRAVSDNSHLFASASIGREGLRIRNLTKEVFLDRVNSIWSKHGFPRITGHCFRIGGTTELLLRGTAPDLVQKMGRWSSDAHLRYWRETKFIAASHAEFLPSDQDTTPRRLNPPPGHLARTTQARTMW